MMLTSIVRQVSKLIIVNDYIRVIQNFHGVTNVRNTENNVETGHRLYYNKCNRKRQANSQVNLKQV